MEYFFLYTHVTPLLIFLFFLSKRGGAPKYCNLKIHSNKREERKGG